MPISRTRTLCIISLLAACSSEPHSVATRATAPLDPVVRDSAGITIYEHGADALERMPLITMDPTPIATIGGENLADDVTRLRVLVMMRDGRIAGWDGGTGAIRIFGTDGAQVASFGRKGEGPGEFRKIDRLVLGAGDTLLGSDWILSRVTLMTSEDGIISADPTLLRGVRQQFVIAGVLDGGDWLLVPSPNYLAYETGLPRDTTHPSFPIGLHTRGEGGESFDTLLVQVGEPLTEFSHRQQGKKEIAQGNGMYSRFPIADGWEGAIAVSDNRSWSVGRYDSGGTLLAIYRVNTPLMAVTDSLRDAVATAGLKTYRQRLAGNPPGRGETIEDAEYNLYHTPWPDSLPPFVRSIPATGPLLWLEETSTDPSSSSTEVAIAPDGRLMGQLLVPADVRLVSFGSDAVILRTEDDDGIIRFEVHRLKFPDEPAVSSR